MVNCIVWVSRSSSSVCVCVHSSEICRWCVWRMIYHEGRVLTGTSAFQHWWDYSTMMIHMCVYMWVCCRPRWGADLWAHLSVFFVLMYPAVVTVGRRNRQEFWSLLSVKKKMQIVLCLESEDSQFYFFSISNWMSLGFGLSVSQNRQFSCGLKCSQVHATGTQFSCFRDKSIGSSVKLQSHNWKQDCWLVRCCLFTRQRWRAHFNNVPVHKKKLMFESVTLGWQLVGDTTIANDVFLFLTSLGMKLKNLLFLQIGSLFKYSSEQPNINTDMSTLHIHGSEWDLH